MHAPVAMTVVRVLDPAPDREQTYAEELAWQERASCAQTDGEAFFPERGGSTREAKRVCLSCEVRVECLAYALANGEIHGIWGGLTARERRQVKQVASPLASMTCWRAWASYVLETRHITDPTVTVGAHAVENQADKTLRAVYEALPEDGSEVSAQHIAEAVGISDRHVRNLVPQLIERELAEKPAPNRYRRAS